MMKIDSVDPVRSEENVCVAAPCCAAASGSAGKQKVL
jgi:hypothetical protein